MQFIRNIIIGTYARAFSFKYYKNENIKNNVIKKILKDDYDKVSKLILERNDKYENENEIDKEDEKGKQNDKLKTLEMENMKLKEQMAKQEMENMKLKEQMAEKNQKTYQNMVNKKEETKQLDKTISTSDSTPSFI